MKNKGTKMKALARTLRSAAVCALCLMLQLQSAFAVVTKNYSIAHDDASLYGSATTSCATSTTAWGNCCDCTCGIRSNNLAGAVATWTFTDQGAGLATQIIISLPTGSLASGGIDIRLNGSLLGTSSIFTAICGYTPLGNLSISPIPNYNIGGSNTITFTHAPASKFFFHSGNFNATVTYVEGVSTPTAGGFINSTTPLLSWVPLQDATSYQLQIDDTPFFDGAGLINKDPILGTTSYTLTGTPPELLSNGQTYYARFRALGGTYATLWSGRTDFTVDTTAPPAPTLNSPADQSTSATETPTLNWSPVTSGTE
jgi:hypothetical protein